MGELIPDSLVSGFLDILRQSGPVGALVAAGIVALALVVIVFARTKGLWDDSKSRSNDLALQDRLLKLVDTLQASEAAMRARIEAMSRESDTQRDQIDELRADLALVRNQRRRLIEMLRSWKSDHPIVDARARGIA